MQKGEENAMKIIAPVIAICLLFTCVLPSSGFGDEMPSIKETAGQAEKLIGDAVIFMADCNALFFGGKKQSYDEICIAAPYCSEKGSFMVLKEVFDKVFGSKAAMNDVFIPEEFCCKKDGLTYISAEYAAENVLRMHLYKDREMYIFSDSEFKYKNSAAPELIFEEIDTIYRFMRFERNSADSIYSQIKSYLGGNVHPRLITNPSELQEIKRNIQNDSLCAEAYANTIKKAEKIAADGSVRQYELPDGVRLLEAARDVMEKCVVLSAAYLITEDEKYAERIWREFIGTPDSPGCFNWKDWNTQRHYLDNSELLYGVAVAFDSCYNYWKKTDRINTILEKTYEYSMKYSVKAYMGENVTSGSLFMKTASNWGFVCNGAIISACIAFGLEENAVYRPVYNYLLENAMQGTEYPLMLYYPDGAWREGAQYWEYATRYFAGSILAPLYFSCGTAYGLEKLPGVANTVESILFLQNKNYAFNYDNNGFETRIFSEAAFVIPLLRKDGGQMSLCARECADIMGDVSARTLMWYRPQDGMYVEDFPLDGYFKSSEVGSMRENRTSPKASCVFLKGGVNTENAHFDAGTFCFDALGKRWASDLGKGIYNIKNGYWGTAGLRLYVRRPEGHNCVVINPREDIANEYYGGQAFGELATVVASGSSNKASYMVLDLSDVYKYDVKSYKRGFYLGNDRKVLTVQDEIDFKDENSRFYWFMHTKADIVTDSDKKGAVLKIGGRELRINALSEGIDFEFEVNKTERRFPTDPIDNEQWEARFASYNVLTARGVGSGKASFAVRLTPVGDNLSGNEKNALLPTDEWILPEEEYVGFTDISGAIPLEKCENVKLDARITGDFKNAELFLNGILLSDEPEPLKNGNYRFSFAVPKNIHEGKAQISIKAAYDNGKAYESRRQALIYSPEALITQTTDFENLKLKSGDLIERTSDIIPELSDISAANGSFIYSKENVSGNLSGKIKYTVSKPLKYSSMSYALEKGKTGMELSFKWYAESRGACVGVQTRPNCFSFTENDNAANIPVFKDGKIFMTDELLRTGRWYDITVRAVKTGMNVFTYSVSVDGVIYMTCRMTHITGRPQNMSGLGLLFGGSDIGDTAYTDDVKTRYFDVGEAEYKTKELRISDSDSSIRINIERNKSVTALEFSGGYSLNEKTAIVTAVYRDGALRDIDINFVNPNEEIKVFSVVNAEPDERISVMAWHVGGLKPVAAALDI